MEQVIQRLDLKDDKHLYSQLYRIRSEYIKDEAGIVSLETECKSIVEISFFSEIVAESRWNQEDG